jgi:anti-sigma factor RsiW
MLIASHPCADDLPAFALGVLDAEEMRSISAHLRECPSCRTAVHSYVVVSCFLSLATPLSEPSPALRQHTLASLTVTPPLGRSLA